MRTESAKSQVAKKREMEQALLEIISNYENEIGFTVSRVRPARSIGGCRACNSARSDKSGIDIRIEIFIQSRGVLDLRSATDEALRLAMAQRVSGSLQGRFPRHFRRVAEREIPNPTRTSDGILYRCIGL